MTTLTKRFVREALARDAGVEKYLDADLARWFGISQAAVSLWAEDELIPDKRALQAMRQRPDLFGTIVAPPQAACDDEQRVGVRAA